MSAENTASIERIPVTASLSLRAVDERYVTELHQLVMKNQRWLQQSLSWPADVSHEDETRRHVQGNVMPPTSATGLMRAIRGRGCSLRRYRR